MGDLSPGERAFWWARARLTSYSCQPALVAAVLLVAGAVAEMARPISEFNSFGGGFTVDIQVAAVGFGLTSQLLLVVASLLVLVDRLGVPRERPQGAWFDVLALLGGLGVAVNLVDLVTVLTEAGIPPVGAGTLAEFYTITVFSSVAPAMLATVPLVVGLSGRRACLDTGVARRGQ